MDLSGAVSVGLKNGDSRAINGEYLSSGMYKIDAAAILLLWLYISLPTLLATDWSMKRNSVLFPKIFSISPITI